MGEYESAMISLEEVVKLNSNSSEGYFNLGIVAKHMKEYENALKHYNRTLQINPKHAQAYNNMGTLYILIKGLFMGVNYSMPKPSNALIQQLKSIQAIIKLIIIGVI
jgi:tetratricopeptide (TPR) repeat protein